MLNDLDNGLDVMQVCRNGHVITDRLHGAPDSGRTHCHRCGAVTLDHCSTCGQALPGAGRTPDLVTIGTAVAPGYCGTCGAAFPWTRRPRPDPERLTQLVALLGRLPLVIRQLRWRQGERPPFVVEDERDLEDLVRALLPIHFDDVRPESRTPSYSATTRTDFVLAGSGIGLVLKSWRAGAAVEQLAEQWREDAEYYRDKGMKRVVSLIYDPEGLLPAPEVLENIAAAIGEDVKMRSVVAG
jgi:hypothetical protein